MSDVDEHKMEVALGLGLRIGVIVSSLFTLVGGVWLVASGQAADLNLRSFNAANGRNALSELWHHGPTTPVALIELGIVLLIATPIFRVAAMVVGFAKEGDKMYVLVSLVVLAVLAMSFFI